MKNIHCGNISNNLDSESLSNNLYILLLSLNRHLFNPDAMCKNLTLPPSHVKILLYLVHAGPTAISKVAKHLHISKPNMTPIIDKLVNDGLVIRSLSTTDRRVIVLESTDKAKDYLHQVEKNIKNSINEKISTLNEDDIKKLSNAIIDMLDIIKKF